MYINEVSRDRDNEKNDVLTIHPRVNTPPSGRNERNIKRKKEKRRKERKGNTKIREQKDQEHHDDEKKKPKEGAW